MSTFMFIDALRPEGKKSEMAKETVIIATAELKSRISLINCEIEKVTQLAEMDTVRASREAAKHFMKALGNITDFRLDTVINAYKGVKNTEAQLLDNKAKLADLANEKTLLQELLAMYPENIESISVEEEKA